MPSKAVPIVLRGIGKSLEVLAFRHPLAGHQLVKGTIEPGEPVSAAAIRELREEAGLAAEVTADLGSWNNPESGDQWHFVLVRPLREVSNHWTHRAPDDGGHDFQFFWHSLHSVATSEWHPVFAEALAQLGRILAESNTFAGSASAA